MSDRARADVGDAPPPFWQWAALIGVCCVLAVIVAPFVWAVLSSFKERGDIMSPGFLPKRWVVQSYIVLFTETSYLRWLFNSIVVSVGAMLLGMTVCALAGFAFAKYRFPGQTVLFWTVIAAMSIPPFTTVIPLFGWMAKLGLINTYPALILPFAANAFGLFMMRQYFSTLPDELMHAARIDGCSEFRLFRSIFLPLARPALGTVGILIFIASWNSFIWPLVMMRSEDMFTLPVGIAGLNSEQSPEYGKIMAAAILSSIPIVTVFFLLQRQIIAGLTHGAVKA
ncbi:MAG TPA: carbohydrate ABC transporter permease [Microvirga sp.]|jgi:ABC-type glycerol-3-phosphate transport system permease component|nr:carbohydrate ABC transporter permease [Microvirga sp.]